MLFYLPIYRLTYKGGPEPPGGSEGQVVSAGEDLLFTVSSSWGCTQLSPVAKGLTPFPLILLLQSEVILLPSTPRKVLRELKWN